MRTGGVRALAGLEVLMLRPLLTVRVELTVLTVVAGSWVAWAPEVAAAAQTVSSGIATAHTAHAARVGVVAPAEASHTAQTVKVGVVVSAEAAIDVVALEVVEAVPLVGILILLFFGIALFFFLLPLVVIVAPAVFATILLLLLLLLVAVLLGLVFVLITLIDAARCCLVSVLGRERGRSIRAGISAGIGIGILGPGPLGLDCSRCDSSDQIARNNRLDGAAFFQHFVEA